MLNRYHTKKLVWQPCFSFCDNIFSHSSAYSTNCAKIFLCENLFFGIFEQPMFYVLLLFLLCVYNYLFDVKVADFWKSLKLQNVQFWSGRVAVGLRWTRVDVGVGVCLVERPSVHVDAGLGRQSPFTRISAKTSTWLSDQRVRFCWNSDPVFFFRL